MARHLGSVSGGAITEPVRRRAASLAAALLVCAGLGLLLIVASRTIAYLDQQARGVEVFVSPREDTPPPRPVQTPVRTERSTAAAIQSDAPPTTSVEAQMLRRMLGCVRRPGERPRADCPAEPTPQDWERQRLRIGGDFAPEEQPNLARIYTRAELHTLVMPSCVRDGPPSAGAGVSACVPFGRTPPPPSRSAEELCELEGIDPCRAPPFRDGETAP